jgi:hypothetical protein
MISWTRVDVALTPRDLKTGWRRLKFASLASMVWWS